MVAAGTCTATTDTAAAVAEADAVVVVVPLFVDDADAARLRLDGRRHRRRGRGACGRAPWCSYETTLPVGTTRERFEPVLEDGSGLTEGIDFHLVFSPERVLTGRVFADLRKYPKLVGGIDEDGAKRGVEFYQAVLEFDERADLARGNGVWDLGSAEAAELAKLAETTYRDVNIGLANQFAPFAASHRHRRLPGHRGLQQPAVQPHPPARHRGRRPLHPGLPAACTCGTTRRRRWCAPPARPTPAMPAYAVGLAAGALRRPGRRQGRGARRGLPRRGEGDGVLRRVPDGRRRCVAAGADGRWSHDPMYTDEELAGYGFSAYHLGEPVDVAIVQTDHESYRSSSPADLPGAKVIIDGRAIVPAEAFPGVDVRVIGRAVVEA